MSQVSCTDFVCCTVLQYESPNWRRYIYRWSIELWRKNTVTVKNRNWLLDDVTCATVRRSPRRDIHIMFSVSVAACAVCYMALDILFYSWSDQKGYLILKAFIKKWSILPHTIQQWGLCQQRSDAYSVEELLLNKQQTWCSRACLHCYPTMITLHSESIVKLTVSTHISLNGSLTTVYVSSLW